MRLPASAIAEAAGGVLAGEDRDVSGVTIDSREVMPASLFVPIVGERDGHDFIAGAVRAGSGAYLTSRPVDRSVDATAIEVADTAAALVEVGRLARNRLPDRVVGVTGSVGKTSTKDMLASVLRTTWSTAASERSFNNELGVPLTLANALDGTEVAIIEMGARGRGHIAFLCDIARPTVGVVTAVAAAHLERFGTLDGVAESKGELVEALPTDGFAVLAADDVRVAAMADRTEASVVSFGCRRGDVRAESVTLDADLLPTFRLVTAWGDAEVTLAVRGSQQVGNALAAAAAGLVVGTPLERVVDGLARARLSAMRMDLVRTARGITVLNDAYNANPASTHAALDSLAALRAAHRVAVLGIMAELGSGSAELHSEVAAHARALGVRVVSVGAPDYGVEGPDAVDDAPGALDRLRDLHDGDAVLIKGSRVAALETVVAGLVA